MRRLAQLYLCVSVFLVAPVAFAQQASDSQVSDARAPDSIVRSIYSAYNGYGLGTSPTDPEIRDLYSARLRTLLAEEDHRVRRDGLGRLDFDIFVDAQDCDVSNLKVGAPRIDGDKAVVEVGFLNFGEPRQFRFLFVSEDGAWRIDEIVAVNETYPWELTALLSGD